MSAHLSPIIAATTRWLITAYPSTDGAFSQALVEAQARQAVGVAARLRYPSSMDAELLELTGPGGAGRLDSLVDLEPEDADSWRTWVDEVVASWACCLLADPALAIRAIAALPAEQSATPRPDFRRLTEPGQRERDASALLRHPDLLSPVAEMHSAELLLLVGAATVSAASN
ncbi:hypothetical protein AB0I53_24610 [Saccharopolyspora sp. NPDC050389]|uniref:hypothetical protein n=1 Tax=Saccharopolyspora sp. NPDC050389 TaxID=3155516 RepID=UPI0033C0A8FF